MAANLLADDKVPDEDFSWLDDISSDDCFMDNDLSHASKTLDFGIDGYTGSLSESHELLQITAPDPRCGLVYVRGDFPDDANSILARAQRRDAHGSWGLKPEFDGKNEYYLEASGFINLRWPCTQYTLIDESEEYEDSLYTTCSFVMNGVLYQIIRINPGRCKSPQLHDSNVHRQDKTRSRTLKFNIGGRLAFGCPCSNNAHFNSILPDDAEAMKRYTLCPDIPAEILSCRSLWHQSSLVVRLWVDRQQVKLRRQTSKSDGDKPLMVEPTGSLEEQVEGSAIDLTATYEANLVEGKPKIIVATFSLANTTSPEAHEIFVNQIPSKVITSSDAQKWMGIADISTNAPYRMWKSALENKKDSYSGKFLQELNSIGRSVEQIIGVASVPIIQPVLENESTDTSSQFGKVNDVSEIKQTSKAEASKISSIMQSTDFNSVNKTTTPLQKVYGISIESSPKVRTSVHKGIALIQNIIYPQQVDPESTFWQIRLLIKAYQYLGPESPMTPLPEMDPLYGQPLSKMVTLYREILVSHIRLSCIWLLNAPISQYTSTLPSAVLEGPSCVFSKNFGDLSYNRQFYRVITVWYILRYCPDVFAEQQTKDLLWNCLPTFFYVGMIQSKYLDEAEYSDEDAETYILQWYHFSCLNRICQELKRNNSARFTPFEGEENKSAMQAKYCENKARKSLESSGKDQLAECLRDYHVTNLALLIQEIIEDSADTIQLNPILNYAKKSIRWENWITTLNPGKGVSGQPYPDTTSPWELSCLSHHGLAQLEAGGHEDIFDGAMDECREFQLSDFTFMASWDRNDKFMVARWWDILPSSVIATTLLNNKWKLKQSLESSNKAKKPEPEKMTDTTNITSIAPEQENMRIHMIFGDNLAKNIARELFDSYKEILRTSKEESEKGKKFNWKERKPLKILHPDVLTQSLEDTPELFRSKRLKLRSNIQHYFKRMEDTKLLVPPNWSLESASKDIRVDDLLYLSCFDLSLSSSSKDRERIKIIASKGRADPDMQTIQIEFVENNTAWTFELRSEPNEKVVEGTVTPSPDLMWSFYIHGCPDQHPAFSSLSNSIKDKLVDPKIREDILSRYQKSLFSILNDSFVDLGTQFRIFFIQRYSPIVIQAFVYMWHTDALDTFDDHLGLVPRFFNGLTTHGAAEVWITSITISHVSLEYKNKGLPSIFGEDKSKKGIFPPQELFGNRKTFPLNFLQFWSFWSFLFKPKSKEVPDSLDIGQTCSSLVVSGDENGFGWTFSIISALFLDSSVQEYSRKGTEIMGMFVHQQHSGRSLVFITYLGHICEKLGDQSEYFLRTWETGMNIDETPLFRGMEWQKSELALHRLKMMLSGMEALRIFDEKLSTALTQITEAREKLKDELKKEDHLRHKILKNECNTILEEFDKRYMRLNNAHIRISQRIEQCDRLREGITSVLGVEQNENIAMLTYITIAYLPLSFIVALFSTTIMPNSQGLSTFGWLMAVFFVATFIIAQSLQKILSYTRGAWKAVDNRALAVELWLAERREDRNKKKDEKKRRKNENGDLEGGRR